jgi:hypothetical protein
LEPPRTPRTRRNQEHADNSRRTRRALRFKKACSATGRVVDYTAVLKLRQSAKSMDTLFCSTVEACAQGITSGFRALPGPEGNRGREREEGRLAADRGTTRFHILQRVFLYLDYGAPKSIWKWQSTKNGPFRTDLRLLSSSFSISFQFLRASVQGPPKTSPSPPGRGPPSVT